mgnify:CR=1 FL=1|tara:strand:- start:11291 stop:11623 length:333 start_codon:yes stop_codon:yes gene_type:complete
MLLSTLWAQSAGGAAAEPSPWASMLPLLLMFAVLYFFILRPQAKKARAHQDLLKNLRRGDEVITMGGIYGKIDGITDDFVTLEVDSNVKLKVKRHNIASSLKETQHDRKH